MRVPWEYENPICAQIGLDFFFPEVANGNTSNNMRAVNACKICPHIAECAEWGIQKERFGIWGGLTAQRRREIRRARGIVLPPEENVA